HRESGKRFLGLLQPDDLDRVLAELSLLVALSRLESESALVRVGVEHRSALRAILFAIADAAASREAQAQKACHQSNAARTHRFALSVGGDPPAASLPVTEKSRHAQSPRPAARTAAERNHLPSR